MQPRVTTLLSPTAGLTAAPLARLPSGRCGVGQKCQLNSDVAASTAGPYSGAGDLIAAGVARAGFQGKGDGGGGGRGSEQQQVGQGNPAVPLFRTRAGGSVPPAAASLPASPPTAAETASQQVSESHVMSPWGPWGPAFPPRGGPGSVVALPAESLSPHWLSALVCQSRGQKSLPLSSGPSFPPRPRALEGVV